MKKQKNYLQFQFEMERDRPDYFHAESYTSDGYYAHFHRNTELYCVYTGQVNVSIGKEKYLLTPGNAVIINSLQVHSYQCDQNAKIGFVLFGEDYMRPFHTLYPNRPIPTFLNDRSANQPILDYIDTLGNRKSDFTPLEAFAHTSMLLHLVVSHYELPPPVSSDNPSTDFIIADIIQYIYNHSEEDLSLETLAEHFGYSRMSISHLISKHIKIDLRNFINDIRVQRVFALQQKPENKKVSVLELASRCGFKSVSSFYRAYRRNSKNK